MEQRKVVHELVDAITLPFAHCTISTDETAAFKRFKYARQPSGKTLPDFGHDFSSAHPGLLAGKNRNDLLVSDGIPEQRFVQLSELALQRRILPEEHCVDILRQTPSLAQLPPVKRDAAKCERLETHISDIKHKLTQLLPRNDILSQSK